MPGRKRWLLGSMAALAIVGCSCAEAAEQIKRSAGMTKQEGFLESLVRAATYTVEASLTAFPQTFPDDLIGRSVDDAHLVGWTKGTMKSQAGLFERLRLKAALWAAYSGYDDELRGVFASPDNEKLYARYVDFKELHLRYDDPAFAVTIGKAPIPVGLSTLYTPANRYRVMNLANPMHPDDLGAWQATLQYFLGDHTLQGSLLPFEERAGVPHRSSRWLGESGERLSLSSSASSGLTGGATGLTPPSGVSAETVSHNRLGYLLKLSGVLPSLDYFLTAHYGQSNFPTIQNPTGNEFTLETPAATTFSGGVAATRGALELHGESLYQLTDGDADQDFMRYVVGTMYRETRVAEWLGLQEIIPVVEYAGEVVTDEQDNPGVTVPSTRARPLRNALLFRLDIKPTDKLTAMVGRVQSIPRHDYAQGFGLEYRPNYNLTLRFMAVAFGGRKDTAFGRWDRNDLFEFSVTRTF